VDPRQHRTLFMIGTLKLRQGQLDDAEKLFQQSLAVTPRFVEAMVSLGYVELLRGRRDGAEAWYQKAIREDPGFPRAYLQYADLHFLRERYEEALEFYDKVLEAIPTHFNAIIQAGLCAQRIGRIEDAERYCQRGVVVRPDSWIPVYNWACLKAVQGNAAGALEMLGTAVDKGFVDLRLLQTDKDLESIRAAPGFPDLVERTRKARAAAARS
jgi:tetratricopeptide (TPR) repeat protein